MITELADTIRQSPARLFLPIGVYGGLEITGATVRAAVVDADTQAAAAMALQEQLQTPALLTAMDLSLEAEAFGCQIRFADDEIPTVIGRRAESSADIAALPVPPVGAGRTSVAIEAARQLVRAGRERGIPALGGVIGPFSLAGRIFGVSEALELSAADPATLEALLRRITPFLVEYVLALRETGVAGVIMAEPAAGLLSPRGLARFSAPYVAQVVAAAQTRQFAIVLHNCGAKLVHLGRVLESGAEIYHFGAPMDLPAALAAVEGRVVLGGNLDPTSVFYSGTPESVRAAAQALLEAARAHPNFFLSSGCDLPPGTPLANIRAAGQAAHEQ